MRSWVGVVLLAAVATVFWDSVVFAPLRLLVVVFHEAGHALATWATGGEVAEIAVDLRGSGHTISRGGLPLLILNAGYLGSLAAGLGLLAAARGPARLACGVVGALLLAMLLLMPLSLGLLYVAAAGVAFLALGRRTGPDTCAMALRAIGVYSALYALIDARLDAGVGDAAMLAERTGVPAVAWTGLWLCAGLAAAWATRRFTVGPPLPRSRPRSR